MCAWSPDTESRDYYNTFFIYEDFFIVLFHTGRYEHQKTVPLISHESSHKPTSCDKCSLSPKSFWVSNLYLAIICVPVAYSAFSNSLKFPHFFRFFLGSKNNRVWLATKTNVKDSEIELSEWLCFVWKMDNFLIFFSSRM